jgi:hypothetical protein
MALAHRPGAMGRRIACAFSQRAVLGHPDGACDRVVPIPTETVTTSLPLTAELTSPQGEVWRATLQ